MKAKHFLSLLIVILLSVYVHCQQSGGNIFDANKNRIGEKQKSDTAKAVVGQDSGAGGEKDSLVEIENDILYKKHRLTLVGLLGRLLYWTKLLLYCWFWEVYIF